MKIFYSDHFVLPLPPDHRFPISKYYLLRKQVLESGRFPPEDLCIAEPATDEQILRAHDRDYLERLKAGTLTEKEVRRIGFPWSPEMVERTRRAVGGTIAACREVLTCKATRQDAERACLAANLAGGTHHAYPDHGEGYCVLNDAAIATRAMQAEGLARRVVIIDCDVHQGNGTASIFAGDESVFTFSIHGAKNFPFHKEQSDLDIALPDGCEDEEFLQALETGLSQSIEQAHANLAIYIAGADPYRGDSLGRLSLTMEGLLERDRLVFDRCLNAGLPVAIVMGGGYARFIEDSVSVHFQTIELAAQLASR